MSEPARPTQPVTETDKQLDELYRQAFVEEVIKQGQRFDELSKILFNIELTALTAYVLLLRFVFPVGFSADNWLTVGLVALTAIFWVVALGFTLSGFLPKKYDVMTNVVKAKSAPSSSSKKLTILEYYHRVAQDKQFYVLIALVSFFLGLLCVIFTVAVQH